MSKKRWFLAFAAVMCLTIGCGEKKELQQPVTGKQEDIKEDGEKQKHTKKDREKREEKQENILPVPVLNEETVKYAEEAVMTTDRVNVRKHPSEDSEVYQTVDRRTKFLRTADDGTWSAVQIENQEYYIASEYLRLELEMKTGGYLIAIDAGHQSRGNSEQEPVGPEQQRQRQR